MTDDADDRHAAVRAATLAGYDALITNIAHGLTNKQATIRVLAGQCPTWWWIRDRTAVVSSAATVCTLEVGHAAPHVNLDTGAVRLGHEVDVAHSNPGEIMALVLHHVLDYERLHPREDDEPRIIDLPLTRALDWWKKHHVGSHDHTRCTFCPTAVW